MTMIKALFVSPGASAYGSARSMLNLLRARRFDAEVVCPGGGALEREVRELGIKHHQLEFGKYSLRQHPPWHLAFYCRFRRILRTSRPDVLVINLDGNTPLLTLAAVFAGIPIIRFSRFEFRVPSRWLDRWCWLKAKAIICPSAWVKQQVLAWVPPGYCERVHQHYEVCAERNVAAEETAAFQHRYSLGDSEIVGYVGRMHRGKRIETAVEALAIVRQQVPNTRLLIVGGYSGSQDEADYKRELERCAKSLGVLDHVTFTGYLEHDQIARAISTFHVGILPSESESFGLVLVEAWAQGVPTVASDVSGCREITRASGGGELCPVGDAAGFAERISNLLRDSKRAGELGAAGRRWVREECSEIQYAERFLMVIEDVASR
jgi:glycosyltransferase involved in cell wall biosynthesis